MTCSSGHVSQSQRVTEVSVTEVSVTEVSVTEVSVTEVSVTEVSVTVEEPQRGPPWLWEALGPHVHKRTNVAAYLWSQVSTLEHWSAPMYLVDAPASFVTKDQPTLDCLKLITFAQKAW